MGLLRFMTAGVTLVVDGFDNPVEYDVCMDCLGQRKSLGAPRIPRILRKRITRYLHAFATHAIPTIFLDLKL
eukprot:1208304-Amorphochlora_amoeboformis.AAC.1